MAYYTSHAASDAGDQAFDLSHIFIGREHQLDFFKIYLDRWQQRMFAADPDECMVTTAPSPNNKLQGLIVLLYGRGGFGKSILLRRYREMVLAANQNLLPGQSTVTASTIVDWEFAIEGKRSLFNPPPGQEIDTTAYFQVLCGQLAISLDKSPKDFKEYQAAVRDTEKARSDASGVLDSMQKDDRYAWLRGLTVEAIRAAIRTSIPGSGVVVDNPSVKSATEQAAKLTQEQISRVYDRLRDRLGNKLGDYLDSALRLGLALGHDLRDYAKNFPLLIFFDTYEEVDEGDCLLRIVMRAASLRVGWILAGRDNLWAGPGQLGRSIALEYGYKEIVLADRGLAIDFNAGGIGAFTSSDIKDYFDLLCKQVGHQLQLPRVTEEGTKRILGVTSGVPLAVKIAAGLYLDTGNLDSVTGTVEGKRAIVDQMVRRYLLHARDSQDERARLYGLAMLRRADQPAAVAAALSLTPQQAETSYASELSRLHRRYSFVFTEKEEPALHQEVRHFLRLWLLEHRKNPEVAAINERLKAAHEEALKRLEARMQDVSLQERLQDEEWTGIYLDLTEQQYWFDPVEGVRCILPFMIAAAIYNPDINEDAATVGEFFATSVRSYYRTWWTWAIQSLVYRSGYFVSKEALIGLEELEQLAQQRCPTFVPPLPDYREKLKAVLWWRLGEAYRYEDATKALAWYEKALTRLGQQIELKEAAARTSVNVAYALEQAKKYTEQISLLDRAIELDPTYALAYYKRGYAYAQLKEYQRTIQDCDRAIELDPTDTHAYNNRGAAYNGLKEHQRAIQDYDRAVELDPTDARAYYNRGNAYDGLKEHQRAIQDYDRAIELDPTSARAYHNRGDAYAELKEYQRAIQDYDRAVELDPTDALAYYDRGVVYLWLKHVIQAVANFSRSYEVDPVDVNVAWTREWAEMSKQGGNLETAIRLEALAATDPQQYVAYVCRGVALGLRGKVKEGLREVERAISLKPEEQDAYFWKGMLSAYYYRGQAHLEEARAMIEQALSMGLPPMLLTPLYWLEKERPDFFEMYAMPLLKRHGV